MGTRQRLYVIGNGFDLHHGIESSYSNFGRYIKSSDPELHEIAEEYLFFDGDWANFEADLVNIDAQSVLSNCEGSLHSYGDDNWTDAYHHDYQSEVQEIVDALSKRLKAGFTNWISQLAIPHASACRVPLLALDRAARYLTFNYTNTLQRLYRIDDSQTLHIHGKIDCKVPDLVLGHAVVPSGIPSMNHGVDPEIQDPRVAEAGNIIDSYFSRTYKPTGEVIERNRLYFDSLSGIQEIFVVGHSLSEVDIPYFVEIVNATAKADPIWVVTYYNDASLRAMQDALSRLGVSKQKSRFLQVSNLPP
jgi:hypothetical protein